MIPTTTLLPQGLLVVICITALRQSCFSQLGSDPDPHGCNPEYRCVETHEPLVTYTSTQIPDPGVAGESAIVEFNITFRPGTHQEIDLKGCCPDKAPKELNATGPDSPVRLIVDCGLGSGKLINKWYIYNWWHTCNNQTRDVRWINMQHNLRVQPPIPSTSASPNPSPTPSLSPSPSPSPSPTLPNYPPGSEAPTPTPNPEVDPCDEPEQPDEGEAEIDGANEKILIFDASELENTSKTPKSVVITHRIVTVNSPKARDLKGVMKITKIKGDESAYNILHNGVPLTFPAEIPIEEPGHQGCGRHQNHAGYESLSITLLKNSPLVLEISVDPDEGSALPDKSAKLSLVPVDIAVDANRDGTIKFAGNFNDPQIADKPADKTTDAKPYRFWLNDDCDVQGPVGSGGIEALPGFWPNNTMPQIESQRDLEDFVRLHINIDAFKDQLEDGTFQVGFEWKNVKDGTPAIKIFKAYERDGGSRHLSDTTFASNQVGIKDVVEGPRFLNSLG